MYGPNCWGDLWDDARAQLAVIEVGDGVELERGSNLGVHVAPGPCGVRRWYWSCQSKVRPSIGLRGGDLARAFRPFLETLEFWDTGRFLKASRVALS